MLGMAGEKVHHTVVHISKSIRRHRALMRDKRIPECLGKRHCEMTEVVRGYEGEDKFASECLQEAFPDVPSNMPI